MKFIHCADAHLDSPFVGLTRVNTAIGKLLYQAPFTAFEDMIDTAISDQVEFVLIAGDTFDSQNPSLKVQWFLKTQFERLAQAQIQVYMIYGNHDFMTDDTKALNYGSNVHIFGPQPQRFRYVSQDQLNIDITGFSYDKRHIQTDMSTEFPQRTPDANLAIGLLHGGLRSTGNQDYAPFTLEDLQSKNYDYWALGHIHQRQILQQQPLTIYPGNLQGRQADESGIKGYYELEYQGNTLTAQFMSAAPFRWQQLTVESEQPLNVTQVVDHLKGMLVSLPTKLNFLLTINLKKNSVDETVIKALADDQLLEILQNELSQSKQIFYPVSVKLLASPDLDLPDIDRKFWDQSRSKVFTEGNIRQLLGSLVSQRFISDAFLTKAGLEGLTTDVQQRIVQNQIDKKDED